ncbi:Hsp90 cochaperone shq1 [Entophlyctis luteolus]|nr:Hsp90 cochaperone shq1 [Entophlyctis luteolus]
MLTPDFTVSQTPECVILCIRAPYVKASEVQFFVDACDFRLHIAPYFLRLTFPHPLVENGQESASYDVGKGMINVSLPKLVPGTFFEGLDMLSTLLAPQRRPPAVAPSSGRPLIEEIGSLEPEQEHNEGEDDEQHETHDDAEFDWFLDQELPESDFLTGIKYGFNNSYSGFASHVAEIGREIFDIDNMDQSTPESRRAERITKEDAKFDIDHYMADFMDDEEIQLLIAMKSPFDFGTDLLDTPSTNLDELEFCAREREKRSARAPISLDMIGSSGNIAFETAQQSTTFLQQQHQQSSSNEADAAHDASQPNEWKPASPPNAVSDSEQRPTSRLWELSAQDRRDLISLPHRHPLPIAPEDQKSVYLTLVDILFAFCFDQRTAGVVRFGDDDSYPHAESAWTIARASPALSALDARFTSLRALVAALTRRALCYPLHRHRGLVRAVLRDDVARVLRAGRTAVIRVLLATRRILRAHHAAFVLDRLFLEDYCLWAQHPRLCNERVLRELADKISDLDISPKDIGWPLDELENLARDIGEDDS